MKIGAGIAGILLGIFSLLYVGIFGGMIGSGLGWLGSVGPYTDSNIIHSAKVISALSWLAPLLAIIGGIVTFSNPRAGGVVLAASAFCHWYLLGFGLIGNLFVLPIGAAALLAFFAAPSTSTATFNATPLDAATSTISRSNGASNATVAKFDRAKWNALVQYDKDIALLAERLGPLGQKWLDEFASSYLALNDKQYLPDIEQKIVAAAKVEAEEREQERFRLEEQRRVYSQEQGRLAQERKEQQERLAEARRKQFELWRDRIWGNRKRKIRTVIIGGMVVLFVMLIAGGILVRRGAEQRKVARTALLFQAVDRADWAQVLELLEKGVDVNAKGNEGVTPLVRAIIKSNSGNKASLDAVNSMIEHDADVNAHTEFGATPLHYASNPVIVSLLLSRGAGVDARDKNGATPLFSAACDSPEKVNQLIASHADVNVQTNNGDTPLHNATSCGNLPAVKALIEHGAQVNVRNQQGKTPLALSLRNPEIGAYLEAHGATGEILLQLPTATGAVNDFAGVISIDIANRMSRISQEILRKTGTAVVVATVKDVGNKTPDIYATELFNTWGIGKKGENKGVLIFMTMKQRKIIIRTGSGVERILPDRLCGEILDQHVIPYLKKDDYDTGLGNAVAMVAQVIAKDAGVTQQED